MVGDGDQLIGFLITPSKGCVPLEGVFCMRQNVESDCKWKSKSVI
jgi:hypothetical protein